ncbi:hypothetical protein LSG31_12805 [Fodinisporobacter ferrooxydans]|uniref:Uncharacterized protein n=1 Tax=Fodinisporobacter ferrooxydans TaxID=2901836 RepID=A0ABY4CHA8_9BACL|nr:hypothetical protein LSG31_12805 [Alicyclobacillaceae bacterium MYW30-H2]
MLMSAGILLVVAIIVVIEVPKFLKNQWKKELWVFLLLLFFGTGLNIMESLQIKIPNPLDWLTIIYQPVNDAISGMLK